MNGMMNFPMPPVQLPKPIQQMVMGGPQRNQMNIPINQQQFKQFIPMMNQNMINQLIAQARQQGISEQDIQNGLNFINSMR